MKCSVCWIDLSRADVHSRRTRCEEHRGSRPRPTPPGALVDHHLPYADDVAAQMIAGLGGWTLEAVGEAMGLTRERVRQIEGVALKKLRTRLELVGVRCDDIARVLATRGGEE